MASKQAKEKAQFNIDLDEGEAVLTPAMSDQMIRMAVLISDQYKAPGIAQKVKTTARTINRYQTGTSTPTLRRAVQIMNLLGYDVVVRRKE